MSAITPTTPDRPRRSTTLALLGLGCGLAGIFGYFLVVFRFGARFPTVRNAAVPNWILVGAGLALASLAVARATRGRRLASGTLLALNVLFAAAFAALLYVVSAVPETHGPAIGAAAPDFALADQRGQTVRLADFRGRPLLLVFYRGPW